MIFDYETLKVIWWGLIGALLIGFAITDGMDMGVGLLLPFVGKTEDDRRVMINTVGPHWDGNQVWLVTAGGAIFAAWPDVYAAAFSGFYFVMLLVLFSLFGRPVAFDYRAKIDTAKWRRAWDRILFLSSGIPALVFGVAFGNLLQGVPFHIDDFMAAHYEGSPVWAVLALLNPFALLTGALSVAMLIAHAAVWLQLRTVGEIAERARTAALRAGVVALILFAIGGLWAAFGLGGFRITSVEDGGGVGELLTKTVVIEPGAWMHIYTLQPLARLAPVIGFAGIALAIVASRLRWPGLGFLASALGIAGIIATAGLSMFPFIMPSSTHPGSSLTVWDATSSPLTLTVMFYAVAVFLPLILIYTLWCYWHMWGKVTAEDIRSNNHSAY